MAGRSLGPGREHGTRACYVWGPQPGRGNGCRCFKCRLANAQAHQQLLGAGRRPPYRLTFVQMTQEYLVRRNTDGIAGEILHRTKERDEAYRLRDELNRRESPPDPVWLSGTEVHALKEHLQRLADAGLGEKNIARAAGVNPKTLATIRLGYDPDPDRDRGQGHRPRAHRGGPKRIRRRTGERLLGVTVSEFGSGDWIAAGPTLQLVDVLLRAGYPKAFIARELGAKTAALQIARSPGGRIYGRTARKVRELYDRLWQTDPRVRLAAEGGVFKRRIRDRFGRHASIVRTIEIEEEIEAVERAVRRRAARRGKQHGTELEEEAS